VQFYSLLCNKILHFLTVNARIADYQRGMALPTGNMLRAGRALAGLTSVELGRLAKIDPSTISRLESSGPKPVHGLAVTVDSVLMALEAKGVVIEADGVRLIRKQRR
jgi:transcriptional regulator with XRE-family HTH domain